MNFLRLSESRLNGVPELAGSVKHRSLQVAACCGGSWIATSEQVATGDWRTITETARFAASLKG
jgi:2-keto-3-deoxy-6-phosphogluconate aldolase